MVVHPPAHRQLLDQATHAHEELPVLTPSHLENAPQNTNAVQITMQRFAIGSALGALWEAPLSCPGWMQEPNRLLRLLRPRSLAFFSIWCFWDGLILLVRPSCVGKHSYHLQVVGLCVIHGHPLTCLGCQSSWSTCALWQHVLSARRWACGSVSCWLAQMVCCLSARNWLFTCCGAKQAACWWNGQQRPAECGRTNRLAGTAASRSSATAST